MIVMLICLTFAELTSSLGTDDPARPRARELGIRPGIFPAGPENAITDVPGVAVGHQTIIKGETVRTGVTAILPHQGDLFFEKVAAGVFVGNGFGKLAGATQIQELGQIETPIILTNTLAVGTAVEALVSRTLKQPGHEEIRSVNAVVGETNDGRLNDIRGMHVRAIDVEAAIDAAQTGPVAEGCVGAGTGTVCFGWKGGIGTSSRILPERYGGYRVGVLVQANYGGVLTMGGVPVGLELGQYAFAPPQEGPKSSENDSTQGGGSCMIVVATNAPLDSQALERLAARSVYALARTGSSFSNGSGDYAIAFSTAASSRFQHGARGPVTRSILPPDGLSPLFQAVLETTEEAVNNALLKATTTTANGRTVEALPINQLRKLLEDHRMIVD